MDIGYEKLQSLKRDDIIPLLSSWVSISYNPKNTKTSYFIYIYLRKYLKESTPNYIKLFEKYWDKNPIEFTYDQLNEFYRTIQSLSQYVLYFHNIFILKHLKTSGTANELMIIVIKVAN